MQVSVLAERKPSPHASQMFGDSWRLLKSRCLRDIFAEAQTFQADYCAVDCESTPDVKICVAPNGGKKKIKNQSESKTFQ